MQTLTYCKLLAQLLLFIFVVSVQTDLPALAGVPLLSLPLLFVHLQVSSWFQY